MTTRLTRKVVRETGYRPKDRPIVILLEEGGTLVRLREKGRRRWVTTTIQSIYWTACREECERTKADRRAKREQKRRERAEANGRACWS